MLASGRDSSIDDQRTAVHVRRAVRGQERDGVGDVLGRADAPARARERSKAASRSASRRIQSAIGVSINPGATQFTRTPRGPQSIARLRVNITTAPFEAL